MCLCFSCFAKAGRGGIDDLDYLAVRGGRAKRSRSAPMLVAEVGQFILALRQPVPERKIQCQEQAKGDTHTFR